MRVASWMMLVACALLAACAEGTPAEVLTIEQQPPPPPPDGPREVRRLFSRPMFSTGVETRTRDVVANEGDWAVRWAQVWRTYSSAPPLPPVDFTREVVVFASMGTRYSGGYSIAVDSALVSGGELHVYVTERSPGRSCAVTAALTEPVDAVAIDAPGLTVRFHEQSIVRQCG